MSVKIVPPCPARLRPNEPRNWYYAPQDPAKATYCEYCYENGCLAKLGLELRSYVNNTCNCDCPEALHHEGLMAVPFQCNNCSITPSNMALNPAGKCVNCLRGSAQDAMCCEWCSATCGLCLFCGALCQKESDGFWLDYPLLHIQTALKPSAVVERNGACLWLKEPHGSRSRVLFETGRRMDVTKRPSRPPPPPAGNSQRPAEIRK